MNKKTVKGIIVTVVVLAASFVIYRVSTKPKIDKTGLNEKTNLELAQKLKEAGAIESVESASKMDKAFLLAWVNSLGNVWYTFEYNGKTYWKKGGTAVR